MHSRLSFLNELDPKYFGDTPIEGIKLFRKGHKKEPVTYRGKGDLLDIVAFVEHQRGYAPPSVVHQLQRELADETSRQFARGQDLQPPAQGGHNAPAS
jgi:hypothetical protein